VFEKSGKGKQLGFVRAKSSGAELTRFPSLAESKLRVYTLRTTCRNRRDSLFRLKSRLDEFLGLLSSFVPIKADARRTLNHGNGKYCWSLRSALFIKATSF